MNLSILSIVLCEYGSREGEFRVRERAVKEKLMRVLKERIMKVKIKKGI